MMKSIQNILFLDCETTGLEPEDRLIQVAYACPFNVKHSYFKPPLPVKIEAMAVHHLTNEMLADEQPFAGSGVQAELQELAKDHVLVAHNAPFDLGMLAKEGVVFPLWIDTKRVAQHLIDSPRYNLQFLRYFLRLNVVLDSGDMAHDAVTDVKILEALFSRLSGLMCEKQHDLASEAIVDQMITLSQLPVLLKTFAFGKYFGQSIEEISKRDRGYLEWLYGSETQKSDALQNADLVYTLKHYLNILL